VGELRNVFTLAPRHLESLPTPGMHGRAPDCLDASRAHHPLDLISRSENDYNKRVGPFRNSVILNVMPRFTSGTT